MQTRSWIAVATSLALLNGRAFAQSGDTAMFSGDLAHSGVYTSPTGRSASEAGTVGPTLDATTSTLKWSFKTGEDPEIHNQDRIRQLRCFTVSSFSAAAAPICIPFHAKTGKEVWASNNKRSWLIASPAARDGKSLCGFQY